MNSSSTNKKKIGILDYGVGNLHSLQNALSEVGASSTLVLPTTNLRSCSGIILPGVGAFGVAMNRIKTQGLAEIIEEWAALEKPLLGICLGMQLLFSSSEEQGFQKGLNLIPGTVERLNRNLKLGHIAKVPNVGWRSLEMSTYLNSSDGKLLSDIKYPNEYYFLHSYACFPTIKSNIVAYSNSGADKFAAVVKKGNILGCQFHPEKSRISGLEFLQRYLQEI